jgi:hypothetical protein
MNMQSSAEFLPNLPGFTVKRIPSPEKKSFFEYKDGTLFMKQELPSIGGGELGMSSSTTSIGAENMLKGDRMKKSSGANIGKTLGFRAYFEESDGNPALEQVIVRKVTITFYLDDGTIQVIERPQMNSGIPQGTLVSRSVIYDDDGRQLEPADFRLGSIIKIYGRYFRIVDCDYATRKYLRSIQNLSESEALSVPLDAYEELRQRTNPKHDAKEWGKYHAKKNPTTQFMEAAKGNFVDNSGREGFIKFGQQKLKYLCQWDNTNQLYGDNLQFTLAYHLADDTIEIFSIPSYNSGRDTTFTKLLKRSKLPKSMKNIVPTLSDPVKPDYVHWTELFIGRKLLVYARELKIIDADTDTRAFHAAYYDELGPSQEESPPPVQVMEREIPPHTGFGSEEDSLASCGTSMGTLKVASSKKGPDKQLSFFASLLSGGIDDVARRFVVTYYLNDSTIKVQEPPIRNSGFVGGVFLSRRKIKRPDGDMLSEKEFFIGAAVQILKHRFLILDANDGTLKYMEQYPHHYVRADFYHCLDKLIPTLRADAESGALEVAFADKASSGGGEYIDQAGIAAVLDGYGLLSNADSSLVSEHEVLTMLRKAGDKKTLKFSDIIEEIKNPTNKFQ